MQVRYLGSTVQYDALTWTGDGFVEDEAQKLWQRLPQSLRMIVLEELRYGNNTKSILENKDRNIVLLSLEMRPQIERQSNELVRVHTRHAYGNYCYDGTVATYEDMKSGCYLAFDDERNANEVDAASQ